MYSKKLVAEARERVERALGVPLRDYSWTEVQDYGALMRDIEWDSETGHPSRMLTEEEQRYVVNELYLSRIDFNYWLKRYCLVLTDEKRLEPIVPWPSQEKLFAAIAQEEEAAWQEEHKKIRIVLLKSRQIGGTAAAEALLAHMTFLNPRTKSVVASDHPDNTVQLWQTLMRMYNSLPGWMRPHSDAKVKAQHLRLDRIDSDIVAGSGNQKTTLGQSLNVDCVHLTEVSTWIPEMCEAIDDDLMPAFDSSHKHHSLMMLESTGKGGKGNWFHDQFRAAQHKDSRFRPVFIAWYLRPGWKQSALGVELAPETLAMADRVRRENGLELSKEQLSFYQWKRFEMESKGKLEQFYQEFPGTIEEAFQSGVSSVFTTALRAKLRDQVRSPVAVFDVNFTTQKLRQVKLEEWILSEDPEKWDNRFVVWEWASKKPGSIFVMGVDSSYGLEGGDKGAVEVLRVGNKWHPDEQVAEWSGNCSPLDLATPAWIIGHTYTDKANGLPAMMAVEVNPGSPGIVTQTELMRRGYPNFYVWKRPLRIGGGVTKETGWWTTPSSRPLLTEMGVDYLKKELLVVNSPGVIKEMDTYMNIPNARGQRHYVHAPLEHDDRLMALFMSLYVAHEYDNLSIAEERRKAIEKKEKEPSLAPVQFQAIGLPWDELMRKWEESL